MTNGQHLNDQLLELVHNPADCSAEHLRWAESLKNSPGVTWGVPKMDDHLIAAHPGDLVVFVARPGHGKTSLLAYHARREAKAIRERQARGVPRAENQIVLYVSLEQITEEIDSYFHINDKYSPSDIVRGNANLDDVGANTIKRVELPVWLMGDSLSRTTTKSLRMTTENIWLATQAIYEQYQKKITLMCVDYLQLIPVARAKDIVTEVTHAAGLIKELGKRCGCPTFVGVQARQEVDDYEVKLPRQRDGQWASRIYQACDKWFSVWRPWATDGDNKKIIQLLETKYGVEMCENLFLIQKLKERFNTSVAAWALHFDPQWLKLCEIEREQLEPVWE